MEAKKKWEDTPWIERASIAMKVAELLTTKYRALMNAPPPCWDRAKHLTRQR
ncbi:MAG: hypothetical protein U5L09_01900 [Bacteroidales bacterium]|nr:hypothetical protein [Bacteroidales bacterium]